jgi:hypothetical protein
LKIERQQQHTVHEKSAHRVLWVGLLAAGLSLALLVAGLAVGSTGWQNLGALWRDPIAAQIVWDIRLPRTLGAWLAGALLGLAGAVAQGLFRNPLADPYLLGSAAGANLGVAVAMAAFGGTPFATALVVRWGLTGAAFVGATVAVFITLTLAKGVQQGLRLLLAGVIVGVVLTALSSLVLISRPDILPAMQSFLLGSTAFVGWSACAVLLGTLAPCVLAGWGLSRADAHGPDRRAGAGHGRGRGAGGADQLRGPGGAAPGAQPGARAPRGTAHAVGAAGRRAAGGRRSAGARPGGAAGAARGRADGHAGRRLPAVADAPRPRAALTPHVRPRSAAAA